jgi:hypothetical protein
LSSSTKESYGVVRCVLTNVLKPNTYQNQVKGNQMEKQYNEWVELLKRTGNMSLLDDPLNVWIEAWTAALIVTRKKDLTEVRSKHSED